MADRQTERHAAYSARRSSPRASWWDRLRWLRLLAAGYLSILVLMMFLEESLIYFPVPYEDDWQQPSGLAVEDAWFEADDGTKLHGWYVPHESPRATILFAHGNAGNLSHRGDLLQILHDRVGASVLIFDYRGYGRSEGKPNEKGVLMDARAARRWLAEREKIPQTDVVLLGRSLGAAVAVDLAASDGARGLVLEGAFTSAPDLGAYLYPWLPVRWLMRTRLDSASKIGRYHGPLLMAHGDADTIVPTRFGRKLYEAANEPKRWRTFPGLDHNHPQPPWYWDELAAFLDGLD